MRASMACLALLTCLGAHAAPASDPLKSDACQQALQALRDVEAALPVLAASAPEGSVVQQRQNRDRLGLLKQRAASLCLQGRADAATLAPMLVGPAPGGRELLPAAAPTRVPAAPAPAPSRPSAPPARSTPSPLLSLVSCDATGCWASDGTRLQRSGTLLLGPRGFCSATGSVLSCP